MTRESLHAGLIAALQTTPDNHHLRLSLASLLIDDNCPSDALAYLADLPDAPDLDEAMWPEASRILRSLGEVERARTYEAKTEETDGDTGHSGGRNDKLRVVSNDADGGDAVVHLDFPNVERVTLDDVCGLDAVKDEIRRRIITPFLKPSLYQRFRRRAGGGLLLYGPPGCGKTLLARATAGECQAEFLNVQISDILDMYLGESERKLRAIFDTARSKSPCVLFFDEIEALGAKRQYGRESSTSKLVSQLLAELDGFSQENQGVLILAATNMPWAVDPALRRPGRLDRTFFVPPPDRGARLAVLELELKDRPAERGLPLSSIAKATSGYSGADLRSIVETACDLAIDRSLRDESDSPVNGRDLKEALGMTKQTTQEWLTTAKNYARYANDGGAYDEVLAFIQKAGRS